MRQVPQLERGLDLIDAGEFFAAHEVLEDAWRAAEPGERDFLQGLVHVAVAWYQAGRGKRVACARQLEKARRRLAPYAPEHRGLDVATLVGQLGGLPPLVPDLPRPALLRVRSELDRVRAFERRLALGAAEVTQEGHFGTAFLHPGLSRVWDLNYLRVPRLPQEVGAEELAEEAERLLGGAGLAHRKIEVQDEAAGERLAPGFEALGWGVDRHLTMIRRRPPERPLDPGAAREAAEAELAPARERFERSLRRGDEETVRQLVAMMARLADAPYLRRFVIEKAGEVVAWCELYSDGRTAQVEDVVTLEEHRGRGHARAVVSRALEEADAGGHDLVFLVADEHDWPKDFYARLGFDPAGLTWIFMKRPPGAEG